LVLLMATTKQETHVRDVPGIRHSEATGLAQSQYDRLLATLHDLSEEEWNAPTDCERWRVRDIIAHMTGWAEAVVSPPAMIRLMRAGRKRKNELGDALDAQNEVQVDAQRHLSTHEVLDEFEGLLPRFVKRRRLLGGAGRYVPYLAPGIGRTNIGFVMNVIFTRDTFMHRIDIARATNRELELGEPEQRIVADVVRQWARESGAAARLHLTGPAGGDFMTADNPAATITGDAVEFCRMLTGRADPSVMSVEGDERESKRWLETPVMF
jgi:uncharacterized protein (TIGR03083 family)